MNRAETAEAIKVMQAYADGQTVQYKNKAHGHGWYNTFDIPLWDWHNYDYRIKPAPKVVPWTAETFPKDRPVWVRRNSGINSRVCNLVVAAGGAAHLGLRGPVGWDALLNDYTQHDGSPCGTIEEV